MADNYKVLAQATAASISGSTNEANSVYAVPNNTQAAISSISLINSSNTAEDYYLGVVKATDVSSSSIPEKVFPFIAVGKFSDGIAYSVDGITWTLNSIPYGSYLAAAYGNEKFIVTRDSTSSVLSSTDGINWTSSATPFQTGYGLAYGSGKFVVATDSSTAYYSTNGVTWTSVQLGASGNWQKIEYVNDRFIVLDVNSSSSGRYSLDGVSWSGFNLPSSQTWSSVAYGDGKFVAVSTSSANGAYSTDGITWVSSSLPSAVFSVAYGNGKFVAVGQGTAAAYSADGINWTASTLPPEAIESPSNSFWLSVTYANNKFVAVGQLSAISAYSTDGITWTKSDFVSGDQWWEEIVYGEIIPEVLILQDSQIIIPNRSIEPNAVDEIVGGITLSAGDQIRVYSDSSDLIVQVYGVEIA